MDAVNNIKRKPRRTIHIRIEDSLVEKIDRKVVAMVERGYNVSRSDVVRSCIALYFK
jgi:Arc/MetJ-type ribon-helix-helix transcriptional regulator